MRMFFFLIFSQWALAAETAPLYQESGKASFIDYTTGQGECVSEFKIQLPLISYKTCDSGKEVVVPADHSVSFEKDIQSKKSSIERVRNETIIYAVKDGKVQQYFTTRFAFGVKDSTELSWIVVKREEGKSPYVYDPVKKTLTFSQVKHGKNNSLEFEPVTIPFESGVLLFQRTDVSLSQVPDVMNLSDVRSECMNRVSQFTSSHTEYRRVSIQNGVESKPEVRREAELCTDFLKKEFVRINDFGPVDHSVELAEAEKAKTETAKTETAKTETAEKPAEPLATEPLTKETVAEEKIDSSLDSKPESKPEPEQSVATAVVPVNVAKIEGHKLDGSLTISKGDWIDEKNGTHIVVTDVKIEPDHISYKDPKGARVVKKVGREIAGKLSFAAENALTGKEKLKTEQPSSSSYIEIGADGTLVQKQHTRIGLISSKSPNVTWVDVAAGDVPFVYDSKRSEILTRVDDNGTFKNVRIPFSGAVIWESAESTSSHPDTIGPIEGVYSDCNQSRSIASERLDGGVSYIWVSHLSAKSQVKAQESPKTVCQKYLKGKGESLFNLNELPNLQKLKGFKDSDFELLKGKPVENKELKSVAVEVRNEFLDQLNVAQSSSTTAGDEELKKKDCHDAVVLKLAAFLRANLSLNNQLLKDQFEITTLKTARMASKSKAGRKFLEDLVREKVKGIESKSNYKTFEKNLIEYYQSWGKKADSAKVAALIKKMSSTEYYKKELRLNNEDVSAFFLAYKTVFSDKPDTDGFSIKDSDVAASWIMGQITEQEIASKKGHDRYSRPANLNEFSVRTAHMNGMQFKKPDVNRSTKDDDSKEKRITQLTSELVEHLNSAAQTFYDSISDKCKNYVEAACGQSGGKNTFLADFILNGFSDALVCLQKFGPGSSASCSDDPTANPNVTKVTGVSPSTLPSVASDPLDITTPNNKLDLTPAPVASSVVKNQTENIETIDPVTGALVSSADNSVKTTVIAPTAITPSVTASTIVTPAVNSVVTSTITQNEPPLPSDVTHSSVPVPQSNEEPPVAENGSKTAMLYIILPECNFDPLPPGCKWSDGVLYKIVETADKPGK